MKGAVIIEGHVQGLSNVRSIGELGAPVIVVDVHNCIARYSKYCKQFFKCPPYDSDEFAQFLIDLSKKENLKDWLLIPSNDHAVLTISRNKVELEKHYKTLVPKLNELLNIYDKKKLLDLAQQHNVAIPKSHILKTTDELTTMEFPVITKGRNGLTFIKKQGKKFSFQKVKKNFKLN